MAKGSCPIRRCTNNKHGLFFCVHHYYMVTAKLRAKLLRAHYNGMDTKAPLETAINDVHRKMNRRAENAKRNKATSRGR